MIEKIEHIGIAVNNIEESLKIYSDKLGLVAKEIEVSETAKAKIAMIPVGESNIELIEPTDPESPIARFLEKNGEGMGYWLATVANGTWQADGTITGALGEVQGDPATPAFGEYLTLYQKGHIGGPSYGLYNESEISGTGAWIGKSTE